MRVCSRLNKKTKKAHSDNLSVSSGTISTSVTHWAVLRSPGNQLPCPVVGLNSRKQNRSNPYYTFIATRSGGI
jgi:hypothetical protein